MTQKDAFDQVEKWKAIDGEKEGEETFYDYFETIL
jgi:hypothetical protein